MDGNKEGERSICNRVLTSGRCTVPTTIALWWTMIPWMVHAIAATATFQIVFVALIISRRSWPCCHWIINTNITRINTQIGWRFDGANGTFQWLKVNEAVATRSSCLWNEKYSLFSKNIKSNCWIVFFFKFICSAIPLRNILTSWTNDSPINRTDFILPKTETPKHRSLTQCLAVFRATPSKFHFWQPKSLEMAVL